MGLITSLHNDSTLTNPVSPLSHFDSVTYDAFGNHTQIQATIPAYGNAPDLSGTLRYWFDAIGRLTRDSMQFTFFAPAFQYDNTYTYDNANNPVFVHGRTVGFNTSNQDTSNTYNHNGNPTTYQGVPFVYDAEKRVTSVEIVTTPTPQYLTYGYKGDDSRAWKQNTQGQRAYFLYDEDDHVLCEIKGDTGIVNRAYGYGANGLIQRYYVDLVSYASYAFDLQGNLANRSRSDDTFALTASTTLYDGFGNLFLDADTLTGGTYPPLDPIGPGGQLGHYTDEELRSDGTKTGLSLLGRNLYDGNAGHFLARGESGFNEYDAALLPYQVFSGMAKGFVNAAWQSVASDVPTVMLALYGVDASSPQAQAVIDRFENPWAVGDSRAEKAGAAYGGFVWQAGSAYFAGTNAIRSIGAALKESGCLRFGPSCFPAGTLVATAPDKRLSDTAFPSFPTDMLGTAPVYLPIERLQVGDVVVSRNEYSSATEYKTIVGVTKKMAQTLVTLHLADAITGKEVQVVQATPEHPFRVFAKGWVRAGQLGIGTSIVTRAGPALIVIAIEHQERAEGYSVYNLTVDEDHTYFVGTAQGGTWVHNSGNCDLEARAIAIQSAQNPLAMGRSTAAAVEIEMADGTKQVIIASSCQYLSRAQQAAMLPGEIYAKGIGHAEVTAIEYGQRLPGFKSVVRVAASRPICSACQKVLDAVGAIPASALKHGH